MERNGSSSVRYFDPDRGRTAAARRRGRRRATVAAAIILFAAVCAAALSLSPGSPAGDEETAAVEDAPSASPGSVENLPGAGMPGDAPADSGAGLSGGEFEAQLSTLLESNPEARDYVCGFQGVTAPDPELDLTEELEPGEIPYLSQLDPRWGYCRYDTGLIGWTGCGPSALSMVAMGLTGDGTLTPSYVADLAECEGYCVPGDGTAWLFFSEGASLLGLQAKELPLWEPTMRAELEAGRPIICIMGPGHFTSSGHYIVITGCDITGFYVLDPARPSNCKVWSYDDISGEIRNLWSYDLAQ